jgi:hypothetical protein
MLLILKRFSPSSDTSGETRNEQISNSLNFSYGFEGNNERDGFLRDLSRKSHSLTSLDFKINFLSRVNRARQNFFVLLFRTSDSIWNVLIPAC